MNLISPASSCQAICIRVSGCVQGCGVRPAIYRLAVELGLGGHVTNTTGGVEIEVEGSAASVESFVAQVVTRLPSDASVDEVNTHAIAPRVVTVFAIVESKHSEALATRIPPDTATCERCLSEVADPANRRFGYPLNSCVACGPRYSVIRTMPYERRNTAMNAFPLCTECRREYASPDDRRFHAEASVCPACGPGVWLVDEDGNSANESSQVIHRAVHLLRQGKIVAVRGLGGYQLLVDATNDDAVKRLRDRKRRPEKPFAVMVQSLRHADTLSILDDHERQAIASRQNPIVLLKSRPNSLLARSVHPGIDTVGLMLPATALHSMILQAIGRPLVCTSGNCEGDPLEVDPSEAETRLMGIADAWLHHNRPIVRPLDDSVLRVIAGRATTIRLARGMAPWSLDLPAHLPTLAVGGFLKSSIAWSDGKQSTLGPHVGDHQTSATRQRFCSAISDVISLAGFQPSRIVHDLHPQYYSTQWSQASQVQCVGTQHHHAHVVAGMLDNRMLDRTVMGVAWDGTGYGSDGTVWGGEFLVARCESFQRIGHLRPFPLPGGEIAIHQPWRVALAILNDALDGSIPWDAFAVRIDSMLKSSVQAIATRSQLSPITTSGGRLFDAAAVICMGLEMASFDGQPAMMLEAVADQSAHGSYDFPLRSGRPFQLDWRPLFRQLWADRNRGTSASTLAMRFHRSIARGIVQACEQRSDLPIVLAGGVFQNRLLVELIAEIASAGNRVIGLPGSIPVNDGGLSAGQLAIAAAREENTCA